MTGYIAGFSGLLSTGEGGTKDIANKIPGAAHYASVTGTADWKEVAQDITRRNSQNKLQRPLCLFGHSNGGYSVLKIAQTLDAQGIEVDYLGIIDLTLKPSPPVYGNVKYFQEFHAAYAKTNRHKSFNGRDEYTNLDKKMGRNIGHSEAATLPFTQDTIVETIAKLTKGEQVSKDWFYTGNGKRITERDFAALSAKHQIPEYLLRAVVEVEAKQKGSHSSGALVFRYELHKAYQYSSGETRNELIKEGLANKNYRVALNWSHANSYPHLEKAAEVAGEELACLASSWGMGQVMGFNHRALGFDTALAMVRNFAESEANQVEGMIAFIKDKGLLQALLNEKWKPFAAGYNGRDYAENEYDTKLAQAADKWRKKVGGGVAENPTEKPVIDTIPNHGHIITYLEQAYPELDKQGRAIVLATVDLIKTPDPPPKPIQKQTSPDPSSEADFFMSEAGQQLKENIMVKLNDRKTYLVLAIVAVVAFMEGYMGTDIPGVELQDNWLEVVLGTGVFGGFAHKIQKLLDALRNR